MRASKLSRETIRRLPWKNGRGETQEIAIHPPGSSLAAADFDWRLSRAAVVEDGPFSRFPGFDRSLVLIAGGGIDLRHGGEAPDRYLPPLEPHAFSGDWTTEGRLRAGPVEDLGLIWRRGLLRGRIEVVSDFDASLSTGGEILLLHLVRGHCVVVDGMTPGGIALEAFETYRVEAPPSGLMLGFQDAADGTLAIAVRIEALG